MAFQESVEVRNAKLDAACECIGSGAVLKIFSGDQPENCAAPDPDGLLAEIELPSPCMDKAQDGIQEANGTWTGTAAADGDATSFRFCSSGGECCRQGTVSDLEGDGDMKLDNVNLNAGQRVTVEHFTIVSANA